MAPSSGDEATRSRAKSSQDDPESLARKIDHLFEASWSAGQIEPAPRARDAEFLRRVHLDLAGRIPPVTTVRDFLTDESPDKRSRIVEELLAGPAYVNHFTAVWRDSLLPEARTDLELRYQLGGVEAWLRKRLIENAGYDAMAREIIAGSPTAGYNGFAIRQGRSEVAARAFYLAKKFKPEQLAGATANLFLGIQLQCAQCHDHPFSAWSQQQFWQFAAFFAGLENLGQPNQFGGMREMTNRKELAIPGKNQVAEARFLDGTQPQWTSRGGPRLTLAEWMTSPQNPYFPRAAVNRMWELFFGIGLVDSTEDVSRRSAASHPEVLDELAKGFVAHGFDLKFVIRVITATRAYQLTSAPTHPSQRDPKLFAVMAPKAMSAEQLFDSLVEATGFVDSGSDVVFFGARASARSEFVSRFDTTAGRRTDAAATILEALELMNGPLAAEATSLERSRTLAAVADAPFLNTAGRIETLYLATLSRLPRQDELDRLVAYVDSGGAAGDKEKALADVFWALLNCAEFSLVH